MSWQEYVSDRCLFGRRNQRRDADAEWPGGLGARAVFAMHGRYLPTNTRCMNMFSWLGGGSVPDTSGDVEMLAET